MQSILTLRGIDCVQPFIFDGFVPFEIFNGVKRDYKYYINEIYLIFH